MEIFSQDEAHSSNSQSKRWTNLNPLLWRLPAMVTHAERRETPKFTLDLWLLLLNGSNMVIPGVWWHKFWYLIIIKSRLSFPSLPKNRCLYVLMISIYFFILHNEKLLTNTVNILKITFPKVLLWITPWGKEGLACTILWINLGAAFSNASVKLNTLILKLK